MDTQKNQFDDFSISEEWAQVQTENYGSVEYRLHEIDEPEHWKAHSSIHDYSKEQWKNNEVESLLEKEHESCYFAGERQTREQVLRYRHEQRKVWGIYDDTICYRFLTSGEILDHHLCNSAQEEAWKIYLGIKTPDAILGPEVKYVTYFHGRYFEALSTSKVDYVVQIGAREWRVSLDATVRLGSEVNLTDDERVKLEPRKQETVVSFAVVCEPGSPGKFQYYEGQGHVLARVTEANVVYEWRETATPLILMRDVPKHIMEKCVDDGTVPDYLNAQYYSRSMMQYGLRTHDLHVKQMALVLKYVPHERQVYAPGDGLGVVKTVRQSAYSADPVVHAWTRQGVKKESFMQTFQNMVHVSPLPVLVLSYLWNILSADEREKVRNYPGPIVVVDNAFTTSDLAWQARAEGVYVREFPWPTPYIPTIEGFDRRSTLLFSENVIRSGEVGGIGRTADYIRFVSPFLKTDVVKVRDTMQSLIEEPINDAYYAPIGRTINIRTDIVPYLYGKTKIIERTIYFVTTQEQYDYVHRKIRPDQYAKMKIESNWYYCFVFFSTRGEYGIFEQSSGCELRFVVSGCEKIEREKYMLTVDTTAGIYRAKVTEQNLLAWVGTLNTVTEVYSVICNVVPRVHAVFKKRKSKIKCVMPDYYDVSEWTSPYKEDFRNSATWKIGQRMEVVEV